jgi:glycosyltransferase involved in cell wall biosynthesis
VNPSEMRFAFNALHVVYGERDGVETEFEQILRHAARLCDDDELVVLANAETAGRMSFPANAEVVECSVAGSNVFARVWYEHRHLNRVCLEHGADAALFFGAVLPLNLQIPGVLIINDMQPWIYPEYFAWYKRLYLYHSVKRSAHAAHTLITISEYSRRDIVRLLGVPESKVEVVPLSGPEYSRVDDPDVIAQARAGYGLPERYFMCLASSYPHKNLAALVEAYAVFRSRHPDTDIQLALLGMYRQAHEDIQETARRLGVAEYVHQPGRIAHEDLAALYSGAEGFVFPSRFEGFGMPVLEAMACGTPVASSNATALPEVYGDAAVEFAPDDIPAMAEAMEQLVQDQQLREELVRRGYERVQMYSWDRTAAKVLQLLKAAGADAGADE